MAALTMMRNVTRSKSRRKIAAKIREKNGPVLMMFLMSHSWMFISRRIQAK